MRRLARKAALLILLVGLAGCFGNPFTTIHPPAGSTGVLPGQRGGGAGAGVPEELIRLMSDSFVAAATVSQSERFRSYSRLVTVGGAVSEGQVYRWSGPATEGFGRQVIGP